MAPTTEIYLPTAISELKIFLKASKKDNSKSFMSNKVKRIDNNVVSMKKANVTIFNFTPSLGLTYVSINNQFLSYKKTTN
jgi:hypothetical protein